MLLIYGAAAGMLVVVVVGNMIGGRMNANRCCAARSMMPAPRAAWEAWHEDVAFLETRKRIEGLEAQPSDQWWHEVILDVQP